MLMERLLFLFFLAHIIVVVKLFKLMLTPSSNECSHLIPSIYAKMTFAAVKEVFGKMGCLDQFTNGQLRFLAAQIKWQVISLIFLNLFSFHPS